MFRLVVLEATITLATDIFSTLLLFIATNGHVGCRIYDGCDAQRKNLAEISKVVVVYFLCVFYFFLFLSTY